MGSYMPSGAGGYMAGAGALESGLATIFASFEEDKRLKELEKIANTPGLDFSGITGEALRGYEQNLPAATKLAGEVGYANQAQLNAQQEQALPGVGAARAADLSAVSKLFDDKAWMSDTMRDAAAMGIGRGGTGFAGSQAGQIGALRLSGQERMQRTQLGTGLLNSLMGSMKLANSPGVQAFMGPSVSEQVGQRASERSQKMNILLQRAGLPTGMEMILNHMQQEGEGLMGAGMGIQGGSGGWQNSSAAWGGGSGAGFTTDQYMQNQRMQTESQGGVAGYGTFNQWAGGAGGQVPYW